MAVVLPVHVTPRSGRDEVRGWESGELRVRVTAPPDAGKANAAVCALVAKSLHVPKSSVTVIRGESVRHKLLRLETASDEDVAAAFGEP